MKRIKWGISGRRQAAWGIAIALLTLTLHPLPALSLEPTASLAPIYLAQTPLPPPISDRLKQDLAQRTGKPTTQFKIASATSQTWPDGCLGLGTPEEICTQALVSGWRVTLVLGKQQWVYRTNAQGSSFRLESAPAQPSKKSP